MMISMDPSRRLEAALETLRSRNPARTGRNNSFANPEALALQILGRTNSAFNSTLRPSPGPDVLDIPRKLPNLLEKNGYGVVDIRDAFAGQFAGLVVETWNNRPGEIPKHVILDCAGVTDFGDRGDSANALRSELAPPNTLVIKVTQPLQGANLILEREAGLSPADRRVSPDVIAAALTHGIEKLLRAQLGDAGPSLLDRGKPPVHLTGLSYATLPILTIAAEHNVGNVSIFEPHVPAVTLGAAEQADLFKAFDMVPELMGAGRQWAKSAQLTPEMRGALWTFLNSFGNAPGRAMTTAFGPLVRASLQSAGADPQMAELLASFAHLRLDPFMPAMTQQMAQTFANPPWVEKGGYDPDYPAGIAARVAGAFPSEFELKKVLQRLPEDVAKRTTVVLQAGSAAAQTAIEQEFAEAMPSLHIKQVLTPEHDMYTFDPALSAIESLNALFPTHAKAINQRYLEKMQNETQGFDVAASLIAQVEPRLETPMTGQERAGAWLMIGKLAAERQFAAEKNLGLAEDPENKRLFVAQSIYPFVFAFTNAEGEPVVDEKSAVPIVKRAVESIA